MEYVLRQNDGGGYSFHLRRVRIPASGIGLMPATFRTICPTLTGSYRDYSHRVASVRYAESDALLG